MRGEDMATPPRSDFAETWRTVEPEVRRSLSSAPPDLVEDVVQETGIKLLRAWASIDRDRPVTPFAVTIARNCLRDELRRQSRRPEVALPDEIQLRDDVVTQVSARIELERVTSLLPRLTPGQRAALLGEVEGTRRGAEAPRVKMLKMRARRRLRELLAQAGGFVVTRVARVRGAGGDGGARVFADLGLVLQAALLAAIAGSGALHVPGLPGPGPRRAIAAAPSTSAERPDGGTPPARGAIGNETAPTEPGADVPHRADPLLAPGAAGGDGGAGVLPRIEPPHSKGHASDGGSFGPEGYDLTGDSDGNVAGHDVAYRYEQRWESPGCVQRLAEGEAPGSCDAPEQPSGYVEVEVDGRRHRADLPGDGRRSRSK
jgi:RNA polymerase sigma factor (sigma-70 family)